MPLPDVNKFGPPWSPLVNSPFGDSDDSFPPVVPSDFFLLMDTTNFKLMNATNFLLMG